MNPSSRDLLGPEGPLVRLDRYEHREGQLRMADAVERALSHNEVLLCEAGTGTGKTLAYLVPAILSGQRVVISTATKALEDQIANKDIPLIESLLGLRPRVAVVKGLGNYLCRRRLSELRVSKSTLSSPPLRRSLALVEDWMRETETGDLAELTAVNEQDEVLDEVRSSSDTRVGASCEYFDSCFVTRMKREAEGAQILIVNHHLFFADAAVKASGGDVGNAGVLGRFDAVIFDEAHKVEDVATEFFGVRVSTARLASLARDAERSIRASGHDELVLREDGLSLCVDLRAASESFFDEASRLAQSLETGNEGRTQLERSWPAELDRAYVDLDATLEVLLGFAETRRAAPSMEILRRRIDKLRADLATVREGSSRAVTWVEAGDRSRKAGMSSSRPVSVGASLIDVGPFLRDQVYRKLGGVVLTSATLRSTAVSPRAEDEAARPVGSEFSFVRKRLGLEENFGVAVEELDVGSPFDHATNTLLYVPRDLPEVTAPDFLDKAGERIARLVELSGGGAFVLSTSRRAMTRIAASLESRLRFPVLVQGRGPKSQLLARFRADGNAVLVATMSFWEGVDVPGSALRMVIIDRIPFSVPTEPIFRARAAALEAVGRNPFLELSVPDAAIVLKQGMGRLLRTATDRGVVAVLDRRLTSKGYGNRILAALPGATRTADLAEVERFCQTLS